jgi:hypothetical protein
VARGFELEPAGPITGERLPPGIGYPHADNLDRLTAGMHAPPHRSQAIPPRNEGAGGQERQTRTQPVYRSLFQNDDKRLTTATVTASMMNIRIGASYRKSLRGGPASRTPSNQASEG